MSYISITHKLQARRDEGGRGEGEGRGGGGEGERRGGGGKGRGEKGEGRGRNKTTFGLC